MGNTILIVDDNPDNLGVLRRLLSDNGYAVRPANSGKVALRALEHSPVDLILLDIRMPEMDGYETCRRLKANPATADIPVIFLSALDEPLDKVKAFEIGGVDYVAKPFNDQVVLARVRVHIRLMELQRSLQQHNQELEREVAARTAELRTANAALVETNAGLEKALKVKDDFLRMMNHEFRNPLNGILGMVQLLGPDLSGKQADYLRVIEQSGWRLLKLVEAILQVAARGEEPPQPDAPPPAQTDIGKLCDEVVSSFVVPASAKAIVFERNYATLPPLALSMRDGTIQQVLGNLLDNAVKYAPQGGRVGLNARFDSDTGFLSLGIWDTGPGIHERDAERIFDPFVQLEPIDTRSHDGPGLGLTIARNLVKLHDGLIQVLNRSGGGATIQVQLPAKPASGLNPAP